MNGQRKQVHLLCVLSCLPAACLLLVHPCLLLNIHACTCCSLPHSRQKKQAHLLCVLSCLPAACLLLVHPCLQLLYQALQGPCLVFVAPAVPLVQLTLMLQRLDLGAHTHLQTNTREWNYTHSQCLVH
jgi:hypothetical protein